MRSANHLCRRPLLGLLASAWWAAAVWPILSAEAQEAPAQADSEVAPAPKPPQAASAMANLINKLAERGVLSKQDSAELISQAEADAADLKVQAAEAALAAAKADAAVARARAAAAQASAAAKQAAGASKAAARLAAAQAAAARILLGQAPAAAPGPTALPESAPVPPAAGSDEVPPPVAAAPSAPPPAPSDSPAPGGSVEVQDEAAPAPAPASRPVARPAAPAAIADAEPPSPPPSAAAPAEAPPAPAQEPTDGSVPTAASIVGQTEGRARSVEAVLGGTEESAAPSPSKSEAESPSASAPAPTSAADAEPAAASTANDGANSDEAAPTPVGRPAADATEGAEAPVRVAELRPRDSARAHAPRADEAAPASDGSVRVTYVPEVVKRQIREEVKDEVLAEVRKDKGAGSPAFPDWVSRFTLYGDIRIRGEGIINHSTNDNTGAFPNFNAINTGAPFDTAGNVFSPQLNVDQNRERMRLRARLGAAIDMAHGFTAGLRLATGNDNNPVTENQTFGAAGSGQGGDFSKYAAWIDRAYLRYQSAGDPSRSLVLSFGRFDNPFFSTSAIWASEIGFDGVAMKVPLQFHSGGQVTDAVKPFIVGGFFPIYNTDLNFATNNPAKFRSYDKWLEAAQVGADWKLGPDFAFKSAAAFYEYKNIEGQLSTPFTPILSTDAGDTDASRPSFAQNGNTYMALRDIVANSLNSNGTINQWQYFGLATPFRDVAFTQKIDYNHFEPFQVSLLGEFIKNVAFNQQAIAAKAVNNLGPAPKAGAAQPFLGGNKAWNVILKFGDAVLAQGGDWNLSLGYRHIESDSVVDGFNDADFGGVLLGTNLKGFTLDANLALTPSVWIEARWMSATAIVGPVYKNDLFQLDLNGKF